MSDGRAGSPRSNVELTCAYLITLDRPYVRMATLSLMTLRRYDPTVHVDLLVVADEDQDARPSPSLFELADTVTFVPPVHGTSGYFQDNVCHLARLRAERIVYLDADTLVFGSVRALAERTAHADVAAPPSKWIWDHGYERSYAPAIVTPFNGGVVSMSLEFCRSWASNAASRHVSILADSSQTALAGWMRAVSSDAYHRHEFALSELAWSGGWSVDVLTPADCCLLERWPEEEDPARWMGSTVFHTYAQTWERCVARLREAGYLP